MTEQVLVFQFDEEDPQRLDHFLVSQMPDYTRSFLQNLIKDGLVQIDGDVAKKGGAKLEGRQDVQVIVPPPAPSELIPERIPLDVIFENKDLIVINKPAGMVVHPSAGHQAGTLVHAVLAHAPDIEGIGGEKRPGLVHRLDKNTSGLIVLAKNDKTHQFLQTQFKERTVKKTYVALVDGHPKTPTGKVEAAIGRDSRNRKRMAVVPIHKGRKAVTEYKTIEVFEEHTLLEVHILTGRTHQIRVHMAFIGCPVAGDTVYGRRKSTLRVKRQFLHAANLTIKIAPEGEPITFEAHLPEKLERVLEDLRE